MEHDKLVIKGARENNLKNIDIEFKNKISYYDGIIWFRKNIAGI